MHVFHKIFGGMANSVNPDQIWVCTICIELFVSKCGEQDFSTITVAWNSHGFHWNGSISYVT